MKVHEIKLSEGFAEEVLSGQKSFEIRFNDRGYQKGDLVKFKVVNSSGISYVFHPLNDKLFEITYVLSGWGLKEGYVAFSIKKIEKEEVQGEKLNKEEEG